MACGGITEPQEDPCAKVPWVLDEATGIEYKVCSGNIERYHMTAKPKKPTTKDVPLTAAQVDKLNVYSAQLQATQKQLQDYYAGILDAHEIEGNWKSLGIEGDPPVLRLQKQEG